jgi:hypothetical protein
MDDAVFNDVVRLVVATTARELEIVLGYLPHGVRYGIVQDLEEFGEAHRFESLRHCAYFLARHEQGIQVWRWSYVATPAEAYRLRSLVSLLDEPLDGRIAGRIFEQATHRSLSNPRPPGMDYFAAGPGAYPSLMQGAASG